MLHQTTVEIEKRRRLLYISGIAVAIACISVVVAKFLFLMISLITNIFYFQTLSLADTEASDNRMGWLAVLIPVIGGIIVGLMARFGSKAIRGHGIPEAMESILKNESRIPKRITILKPLSSAIAIGTGGPFGAEGPIIATGSSFGSLIGQVIHVSNQERKILVASGAAAGMTAIFGTPLAAVLLAIELLLFEFRAKSFIPVVIASSVAAILRYIFFNQKPFFEMPAMQSPTVTAFVCYLLFGVVIGFLAVVVTKILYCIEDLYEKIPMHWMYWPALSGLIVGLVGLYEPRTLAVGYNNITDALSGNLTLSVAFSLVVFKFLSWSIALSSGTSGGTLAPLMTIGGCFGFIIGHLLDTWVPYLGVDVQTMALIGMAGIFAGSSRAVLTSAIFAFEATRQPVGLVPLLSCCSIAYIISILLMKNTIMTEKIARRGIKVPYEYFPRN